MSEGSCHLESLPLDIIYEILSHLPLIHVIQSRQLCRRIRKATYQKTVWINVYERSDLLLPQRLLSPQSSAELEAILVRAAKIYRNWTSPNSITFSRRTFPRKLPTYDFEANVLAGRYLQLVEGAGISWYDLDGADMSTPILTYPCLTVVPKRGCFSYQSNANNEGSNTFWVTFISPSTIVILKVHLSDISRTVHLHAELPVMNTIAVRVGYDWLLPIREPISFEDPMDVFHIPSKSIVHLLMHEKIRFLPDIGCVNYVITPLHLILTFSLRSETFIDLYLLPDIYSTLPIPLVRFSRTHHGTYPHAISQLKGVEPCATSLSMRQVPHPIPDDRVTFLGLVYVSRSPTSWTSKIGLHLFDADLHSNGTLVFSTRCSHTLDVGIATTSLSLTSGPRSCLAVTHSSPGPVVLTHHIKHNGDRDSIMQTKPLKLPGGFQSRDMLSFDGFLGRICLINGWTRIEILDCA